MSNQNEEMNGAAVGIAFIGLAVISLGLVLFVALTGYVLFLTVLSLIAWNKPLTFMNNTIYPHEAHAFVISGSIGTFVLPMIVATIMQVNNVYSVDVPSWLWPCLMVAGYDIAAIGAALVVNAIDKQRAESTALVPLVQEVDEVEEAPAPRQEVRSSFREPLTYHFADWDDDKSAK